MDAEACNVTEGEIKRRQLASIPELVRGSISNTHVTIPVIWTDDPFTNILLMRQAKFDRDFIIPWTTCPKIGA